MAIAVAVAVGSAARFRQIESQTENHRNQTQANSTKRGAVLRYVYVMQRNETKQFIHKYTHTHTHPGCTHTLLPSKINDIKCIRWRRRRQPRCLSLWSLYLPYYCSCFSCLLLQLAQHSTAQHFKCTANICAAAPH